MFARRRSGPTPNKFIKPAQANGSRCCDQRQAAHQAEQKCAGGNPPFGAWVQLAFSRPATKTFNVPRSIFHSGCFFVAAAALIAAGECSRVFATAPFSPWSYRTYQTREGLPDISITSVAQTSDGYLWVATKGGLVCFNGSGFASLPRSNLPPLPSRAVRAMFRDHRDQLWLGMERGTVLCFKPDGLANFTPEDGLPRQRVVIVAEERKGAVWLPDEQRNRTQGGAMVSKTFCCRAGSGTAETFHARAGGARASGLRLSSEANLWGAETKPAHRGHLFARVIQKATAPFPSPSRGRVCRNQTPTGCRLPPSHPTEQKCNVSHRGRVFQNIPEQYALPSPTRTNPEELPLMKAI